VSADGDAIRPRRSRTVGSEDMMGSVFILGASDIEGHDGPGALRAGPRSDREGRARDGGKGAMQTTDDSRASSRDVGAEGRVAMTAAATRIPCKVVDASSRDTLREVRGPDAISVRNIESSDVGTLPPWLHEMARTPTVP
jgi:hypothetical protein